MTIATILHKRFIAFFIFFLPVLIKGQVKFAVTANHEQITLDDFLQIQYTIENAKKIDQFIPPRFTAFEVIRGPEQSSGWSLMNGELKQYNSFSYVLKPLKKGRFFLPAASAKIEAGTIRSNTLQIDVLSPSGAQSRMDWPSEEQRSFEEFILRKGETVQDKIRNNLFVRLEVNKSSCYEGEPVVATYKLYTRLKSESKVVKRPAFSGFSVYDMIDPESENAVKEKFNGKEYHVYLLRKAQLYPLQAGNIELEQAEVENIVTFVKAEYAEQGYSMSDLLNALSADRTPDEYTVKEKVSLTSRPVNIEVKPLPTANQPASYNGAVGEFNISAVVTKTDLNSNDVANFNLIITGKGNLPMLSVPSINWPDSFEIFEPVIKDKINKYFAPIEGSRVFSIGFSPKKQGKFLIPAVNFSYFDPDSGKYKLAKTDSIKINVSALPAILSNPIANIKEGKKNLWDAYPWSKWLMIFLTITVGAFGFHVLYVSRKADMQKGEPTILQKQPEQLSGKLDEITAAQQPPVDPLIRPKFLVTAGQGREFYRVLKDVLQEYLQRKLGIVSTNPGIIRNQLTGKGVDFGTIRSLEQILSDCDMALFTPVNMEQKMANTLNQAESVLNELKKSIAPGPDGPIPPTRLS